MSVQRWAEGFRGEWVTYADHVAALAEMERRTREDDNRALWDNRAREAALREAREAIASLVPIAFSTEQGDGVVSYHAALAAIDALKGEQT